MTPLEIVGVANEGESSFLRIDYKDEDGNLVTPTSAQYRVTDFFSGNVIVPDTALTISGTFSNIAITPAQNAIQDATRETEYRRVTVRYDLSGSRRSIQEFYYALKNLGGVP